MEVHAFGSSVNGFGDETSDIDLVLDVPEVGFRVELHPAMNRCSMVLWQHRQEILEQIVPWNYVRDLIPATLDYLSDYLVQDMRRKLCKRRDMRQSFCMEL